MRYKLLGRSGLRVSEFCLGTMTFGDNLAWGAGKQECARIVGAFAEAGGNFIDTADKYAGGTSERYVGELIAAERDRWVLATKYSLTRDPHDPNAAGNHRKSLIAALEASLRRLATDYVDVLWLHIWDFVTPIDEVMRALDDQVRAGKVLYVGVSNTPAWIVARANLLADLRGWSPFVALQTEYSLAARSAERELAPMAQALDIALTAWSPLATGVLTGKYREDTPTDGRLGVEPSMSQRFLTPRNREIAAAVAAVAAQADATPAQVALAWLMARPGTVIPIVGASSERQLRENLGAATLRLDAGQLAALDDASAVALGTPHEFLAWATSSQRTFGEGYGRLDDHRADRAGRSFALPPEAVAG